MEQALALERAGCFALVLEAVPATVGAEVTGALEIPTIGIGAGPDVGGQVLVLQDLLGVNTAFRPKFVRIWMDGANLIREALQVCIVKTAPPTKSRTYAPLEFRAEDGETPPLCSTLLSSSSHLASVSFGRCVGAAPTWCWRTSLCGSK